MAASSLAIKEKLYRHCLDYVERHIAINSNAVAEAQDAVRGETKNTAGDRYETERAMKQRETELFGRRLDEAVKQQEVLRSIDISRTCDSVGPGALVSTSMGSFFIAISADEITVDGEEYFIISPESPIAAAMANRTQGESFPFRDKTVFIEAVC